MKVQALRRVAKAKKKCEEAAFCHRSGLDAAIGPFNVTGIYNGIEVGNEEGLECVMREEEGSEGRGV